MQFITKDNLGSRENIKIKGATVPWGIVTFLNVSTLDVLCLDKYRRMAPRAPPSNLKQKFRLEERNGL